MLNWLRLSRNIAPQKSGLNNRVTFQSWWKNQFLDDIYHAILGATPWLPDHVSFSERLYSIMNHLSAIPL